MFTQGSTKGSTMTKNYRKSTLKKLSGKANYYVVVTKPQQLANRPKEVERRSADQGHPDAQSGLDDMLARIIEKEKGIAEGQKLIDEGSKILGEEITETIVNEINEELEKLFNPPWDPNDLLKVSYGDCMNCNLQSTDLEGADLRGFNLQGAGMRGARMKHAILCNTTMPEGSVIFSGC